MACVSNIPSILKYDIAERWFFSLCKTDKKRVSFLSCFLFFDFDLHFLSLLPFIFRRKSRHNRTEVYLQRERAGALLLLLPKIHDLNAQKSKTRGLSRTTLYTFLYKTCCVVIRCTFLQELGSFRFTYTCVNDYFLCIQLYY